MKYMYKKPHFFSFSGRSTISEFWSSLFVSVVGGFCALIVLCILVCIVVPGEMDELKSIMNWVTLANSLFWFTHIVAMSRRRLRDAGFTAKSYLWLLLPVVGWFIFIFRYLCARSVDEKTL